MRPVDVRNPIHLVNSNKTVRKVNSNKPLNSKIVRHVNSSKPVCPVNSSKHIRPIDVCKSLRPVNSIKSVYPVEVCKSIGPVDVHKPVFLVDICKPFSADYWRHVSLFLILLFFAVSINTTVFNRTILYMILFININKIFNFHEIFQVYICYFNTLFLYIEDRLFKYLFLGIFIIGKQFSKLLLIIFVMNFAFVNIFYLNNASFGVDNAKTIHA